MPQCCRALHLLRFFIAGVFASLSVSAFASAAIWSASVSAVRAGALASLSAARARPLTGSGHQTFGQGVTGEGVEHGIHTAANPGSNFNIRRAQQMLGVAAKTAADQKLGILFLQQAGPLCRAARRDREPARSAYLAVLTIVKKQFLRVFVKRCHAVVVSGDAKFHDILSSRFSAKN